MSSKQEKQDTICMRVLVKLAPLLVVGVAMAASGAAAMAVPPADTAIWIHPDGDEQQLCLTASAARPGEDETVKVEACVEGDVRQVFKTDANEEQIRSAADEGWCWAHVTQWSGTAVTFRDCSPATPQTRFAFDAEEHRILWLGSSGHCVGWPGPGSDVVTSPCERTDLAFNMSWTAIRTPQPSAAPSTAPVPAFSGDGMMRARLGGNGAQCVALRDSSPSNEERLIAEDCQTGNERQLFIYDPTVPHIRSAVDQTMCWDIFEQNDERGTPVQAYKCWTSDAGNLLKAQTIEYNAATSRVRWNKVPDRCVGWDTSSKAIVTHSCDAAGTGMGAVITKMYFEDATWAPTTAPTTTAPTSSAPTSSPTFTVGTAGSGKMITIGTPTGRRCLQAFGSPDDEELAVEVRACRPEISDQSFFVDDDLARFGVGQWGTGCLDIGDDSESPQPLRLRACSDVISERMLAMDPPSRRATSASGECIVFVDGNEFGTEPCDPSDDLQDIRLENVNDFQLRWLIYADPSGDFCVRATADGGLGVTECDPSDPDQIFRAGFGGWNAAIRTDKDESLCWGYDARPGSLSLNATVPLQLMPCDDAAGFTFVGGSSDDTWSGDEDEIVIVDPARWLQAAAETNMCVRWVRDADILQIERCSTSSLDQHLWRESIDSIDAIPVVGIALGSASAVVVLGALFVARRRSRARAKNGEDGVVSTEEHIGQLQEQEQELERHRQRERERAAAERARIAARLQREKETGSEAVNLELEKEKSEPRHHHRPPIAVAEPVRVPEAIIVEDDESYDSN